MSPTEFAAKIRAKYPDGVASDGVRYADMSDDDLTNRITAKYPVYESQIVRAAPKPNTFQTPLTRIAAGKGKENLDVARGAAKEAAVQVASVGAHNAGPVGAQMMADARAKGNKFAGAIDSFNEVVPPKTALEKEGGRGTLIATAAIPGPRTATAVGQAAAKVASPFTHAFDAKTAAELAEEGIHAPVSAITNSPFLKSLEAMSAKGVFGGKVMDTVTNARAAIDSKIAAVADAATPKKGMSNEALGKLMSDDLRASITTFKDRQDKVFSTFSAKYGDVQERPFNTIDEIKAIVADQGQDFYLGVDPRIQRMADRLTGETAAVKKARKDGIPSEVLESMKAEFAPEMSISEMRATRSAIGETLAKTDDPALKRLYGALTADLKAALGVHDKEGAQLMQKLDADYASGITRLEGRIAQSIEKANPENIVHRLFERDSADAIGVLKNLVKPETFDQYRAFFLNDIFSKATVRGKFSVEKLKQNIAAYDEPTMNAVLDPQSKQLIDETIARLEKLEGLSEKLKPTEKLLGGSQTAFLQQAMAPGTAIGAMGTALITGQFGVAALIAGGLAGKYGVAKLFTTQFGRKFLTEGFKPNSADMLKIFDGLKEPSIGLSMKNVGRVHETDRRVMVDFIDSVRTGKVGGGKLTDKQKLQFEIEARRAAPGFGINPDLPPKQLADRFDNFLTRSAQKRKQPLSNYVK